MGANNMDLKLHARDYSSIHNIVWRSRFFMCGAQHLYQQSFQSPCSCFLLFSVTSDPCLARTLCLKRRVSNILETKAWSLLRVLSCSSRHSNQLKFPCKTVDCNLIEPHIPGRSLGQSGDSVSLAR